MSTFRQPHRWDKLVQRGECPAHGAVCGAHLVEATAKQEAFEKFDSFATIVTAL